MSLSNWLTPLFFWLPVCNPFHNRSRSLVVNQKPLCFNDLSKNMWPPAGRKPRQISFPLTPILPEYFFEQSVRSWQHQYLHQATSLSVLSGYSKATSTTFSRSQGGMTFQNRYRERGLVSVSNSVTSWLDSSLPDSAGSQTAGNTFL